MKEFASLGANSFIQELTPIEKEDKNENGGVASPVSISIHLKAYISYIIFNQNHIEITRVSR